MEMASVVVITGFSINDVTSPPFVSSIAYKQYPNISVIIQNAHGNDWRLLKYRCFYEKNETLHIK